MATATHYWLSTVGGDGSHHVRPIAGLWLDEGLYFERELELVDLAREVSSLGKGLE